MSLSIGTGLAVEFGPQVVVQLLDGERGEVVEGAVGGDADHRVDAGDLAVQGLDAIVRGQATCWAWPEDPP
jgi:hypothetical protein